MPTQLVIAEPGYKVQARALTTSDDVMNKVLKALPTRKQDIPALVLPQPQLPNQIRTEELRGLFSHASKRRGKRRGPANPFAGPHVYKFGGASLTRKGGERMSKLDERIFWLLFLALLLKLLTVNL